MKKAFLAFGILFTLSFAAEANRGHACSGSQTCEAAVSGRDLGMCRAYKEHRGCLALPAGDDRGWCQVITEGKSCYEALIGVAQEKCEEDELPNSHLYWKKCGEQ